MYELSAIYESSVSIMCLTVFFFFDNMRFHLINFFSGITWASARKQA